MLIYFLLFGFIIGLLINFEFFNDLKKVENESCEEIKKQYDNTKFLWNQKTLASRMSFAGCGMDFNKGYSSSKVYPFLYWDPKNVRFATK